MSKFFFIHLIVLGALVSPCFSQQADVPSLHITEEVTWHGKNGKSIRGIYAGEVDGTILLVSPQIGKTYKRSRETMRREIRFLLDPVEWGLGADTDVLCEGEG